MSNNSIYLGFKSSIDKLLPSLGRFSKEWKGLGTNIKSGNASMAKAYPHIKKMNMGFTNITKDANRAGRSIAGLTNGLFSMRRAIGMVSFYAIYRGLASAIDSAMDMIETSNLFSVAMGELALETNETVKSIANVTGLDLTNIQTAVGTFGALSKSMGMTQKQSQQLSTTTYRLALDLASLYNVDINQAIGDLRSGLVGQSETVYKYGIDVTEASLKTEALAQGITKSVRNMSQGEKMALRYAVMIRQSGVAQGDFARTINQPANQLRILTERIVTLSRSIGTVFIPVLKVVLPWLNAFVQTITLLINKLALLFGYDPSDAGIFNFGGTGLGNTVNDAEELDSAIGGAEKSAKKLKGQLMGFDEINLWTPPTEDTGAGAGGTGAIAGGVDMSWMEGLTYDSMFDTISQKSTEMVNIISEQFKKWYDSTENIRSAFGRLIEAVKPFAENIGSGLFWFYQNVLEPIGLWAMQNLFPTVLDLISSAITLLNSVIETVSPLFVWLYEQFLVPIAQWTGGKIIEVLEWLSEKLIVVSDWVRSNQPLVEGFVVTVLGLATAFIVVKNAIDTFIALKTILMGASTIMGGAFTFLSSPIGIVIIVIGALIAIGILLVKNWEFISTSATNIFGAIKKFWDTWWGNVEQQWADMTGKLSDAWEEMWIGVGNFFVGIANKIIEGFANLTNGIIDLINGAITGLNFLLQAFGYTYRIKYFAEVEFEKIPEFKAPVATKPMQRFADGGIPDYGQMFIAREAGAELVGGFGGKTGVMNNDQIVEAVSAGVYSAVASAMTIGNAGSGSGQGDVILEVDGVQLGRILLPKMNKESTRLGFKPILQDR